MKARGFSLAEILTVTAIAGIVMSLGVSTMQELRRHAQARGDKAEVLAAVGRARTIAQRTNAPVQVILQPHSIQLARAVVSSTPESVRRIVDSYVIDQTVQLPHTVTVTALETLGPSGAVVGTAPAGDPAATIRFCASSDNYFRNNDPTQSPVCGVGNLASANAKIIFTTEQGALHHVFLRAPLGALALKDGP